MFFKYRIFLATALLICAASSLAWARRPLVKTETLILERPTTYEGILFPRGSRLELTEDKSVYYAWPGEDLKANGILVLKNTQVTLQNGKLTALWTQDHQKILDVELPPNTWVTFKKDGSVDDIFLQEAFEIRGLKLISHVQFYKNGSFKAVTLSEDQTVNGLKIKKGEVEFHNNGQMMKGFLAETAMLKAIKKSQDPREVKVEAGTRVYLDDKGLLVGAFPSHGGPIEYSVELHPPEEP